MVVDPKSLPHLPTKELIIYVRALTLKDLDAVMRIETQAFVPEERCTRKKFHSLLSTSPSTSLGIFTTLRYPTHTVELLLGHAMAAPIGSPFITDSCYSSSHTPAPHHTYSTVALHSLAIEPRWQRLTLGTRLLKEFISRCSAERIAIIAREELVRFYERFGFVHYGLSSVGFGGGGWMDLVLDKRSCGVKSYPPVVQVGCGGFMEGVRSTPLINDMGM